MFQCSLPLTDRLSTVITRVFQYHREESPTHEFREFAADARTLVIMPAWNEEEIIGNTITELLQRVPEVDLVVVNDGSTDHTSEIARRAGAFVIDLPYNMGGRGGDAHRV